MKELLSVLLLVNVLKASPIALNGSVCIHNGKTYHEGYNVSLDKCNTCVCRGGMMQCTEKFCLDKQEPSCLYLGQSYTSGSKVLSADCNSCFCSNGIVSCTQMKCINKEVKSRAPEAVS